MAMCAWQLIRPGISQRPPRSLTVSPGWATRPGPTSEMTEPDTRTAQLAGENPSPVNTETFSSNMESPPCGRVDHLAVLDHQHGTAQGLEVEDGVTRNDNEVCPHTRPQGAHLSRDPQDFGYNAGGRLDRTLWLHPHLFHEKQLADQIVVLVERAPTVGAGSNQDPGVDGPSHRQPGELPRTPA